MYKLWRLYNQNREKIWVIIIIILFFLFIIRTLNNMAKEDNEVTNEETSTSNIVSSRNENRAIITQNTVPEEYANKANKILNEFFTYCINHEPEKAYAMLSSDVKNILYPSLSIFESLYYEEKFIGDKQYSTQAWLDVGGNYTYQVKIFDNMLSTGKSNKEYMEDYITIQEENGMYKLNINSFMGRKKVNQKNSNDLLEMELVYIDVYKDYQTYELRIKNNTDKQLLLDTTRKNKTIYVTDEKENKFEAVVYELNKEDLQLQPKEAKTIKIKFNVAFRSGMQMKSINFSDIVDYEEYANDENIKGENFQLVAQ